MRLDKGKPYYTAYDKRYRSAYEQGADSWISPPEEKEIREKVANYIKRFGLIGRRVVEFGCGEGVAGLLFAKFGCIYQGYDISPAAIKKRPYYYQNIHTRKYAFMMLSWENFPKKPLMQE